MRKNERYVRVGTNNTALMVRMTEQLNELGCTKGDHVFICNEDNRIIIEKASRSDNVKQK